MGAVRKSRRIWANWARRWPWGSRTAICSAERGIGWASGIGIEWIMEASYLVNTIRIASHDAFVIATGDRSGKGRSIRERAIGPAMWSRQRAYKWGALRKSRRCHAAAHV